MLETKPCRFCTFANKHHLACPHEKHDGSPEKNSWRDGYTAGYGNDTLLKNDTRQQNPAFMLGYKRGREKRRAA